MPECESRGCTNVARHTVVYEDPDEEIGYCLSCATYRYRDERNVVAVEEGYNDG